MKPREDVLSARIRLKSAASSSTVPGSSRHDPEPQTWSPPSTGQPLATVPPLHMYPNSRQRLGLITGEDDSLSLSPWTSAAVSCLVDPMWLRRHEGIISFSVEDLRGAYTSSYIDLNIGLNLLSPVCRHVGQLSAGGQLASVATVHISFRQGFSCSYSMRKWKWDM